MDFFRRHHHPAPTPTPSPTPTPAPSPTAGSVIMNMIGWNPQNQAGQDAIAALDYTRLSRASYFAAHLSAIGTLNFPNIQLSQAALVSGVHVNKGKVTLSIGGATQNQADLAAAIIGNNLPQTCANIAAYVSTNHYDGVKVDFEDTNINADEMVAFFTALRSALGPTAIIDVDVQPCQSPTVWARLSDIEPLINGICVMLYDETTKNSAGQTIGLSTTYPSKLAYVQAKMAFWTGKMNGHLFKLFPGVAISNNAGGTHDEDYTTADVKAIAAWAKTQSMSGLMVWSNYYATPAYWTATDG